MSALELLAREVEAAADEAFFRVGCGVLVGNENLANLRHGAESDLAERFGAGRDVAPAEDDEVVGLEAGFEDGFGAGLFERQEENADTERAFGGESDAGFGEQDFAWHGGHDADAVAALAVGRGGSAMGEASERGERVFEDGVGRDPGRRGDEAYAAGVGIEA